MNTRKVNYDDVARLYNAGATLTTLQNHFDLSPARLQYILKATGVVRNRLRNPMTHSMSEAAIRSRLYRYQQDLEAAIEDDDAKAIREATESIAREKRNLSQIAQNRKAKHGD